jgi:hypothetical protein
MQISKIVVENVKGIQRVEMCPVRPVNVLIGRNNSGKSSVLVSLRLLTGFCDSLKDGTALTPKACKVANEFFRTDREHDQSMRIAVTVSQSIEERREQLLGAVKAWNAQHERKMDVAMVDRHLESHLFRAITFAFVAKARDRQLGLGAITTPSPGGSEGAEAVIAEAPAPGQPLKGVLLRALFMKGREHRCESVSEVVKSRGLLDDIDIRVTPTGLESREPILVHNLLRPSFEFFRSCFSSVFFLNAYRHGEERVVPHRSDTLPENGTGLVNFVHNLILNNHTLFTEIAELVRYIVPEVGRLHARFTGIDDHSIELAYEWADGRVVNLANMGGGVEQLVILGCVLLAQKTACIFWEEPESHLHPGAQDKLLSELESRVGQSLIFLTTHSPVFVRPSDKIAVHAITNPDGKSAAGRTLLKEQLQEACTILGSRPGHLAQADIVLYVEGKYGAAAVEEWLRKWPDREASLEHLLLVVQPCNPDEIGTNDFDLSTLKKLTPNMVVFVDRDNDVGSQEPKEARKRLAAMCQQHSIPCIITEFRQIEDYFSPEAVKAALPTNLLKTWTYDPSRPMGEQLGPSWKKHNRRIAEEMTWSDIEKHQDLMQLFEEVEKLAKVLRP